MPMKLAPTSNFTKSMPISQPLGTLDNIKVPPFYVKKKKNKKKRKIKNKK